MVPNSFHHKDGLFLRLFTNKYISKIYLVEIYLCSVFAIMFLHVAGISNIV